MRCRKLGISAGILKSLQVAHIYIEMRKRWTNVEFWIANSPCRSKTNSLIGD